MTNLAEKLLPFQKYKQEIECGFLLDKEFYENLNERLLQKNYYLLEQGDPNNNGNIYVKKNVMDSEIFMDFDITSMTHGFSYFTSILLYPTA